MSDLYHTLNQDIAKKDLKKAEKEELIEAISMFGPQESRALYNLIQEDMKLYPPSEAGVEELRFPYESTPVGRTSVQFHLSLFPIRLRRIIYKFAKIVQKIDK